MSEPELSYNISYNNIVFIESLHDESKTGKWLYEDLKPLTYRPNSIAINYLPVSNLIEFIEALMSVEVAILTEGMRPIIHLDFHGDQNGVEIKPSGDFISWEKLCNTLAHMNLATKNNLILCMNVCEGFFSILNSFEYFVKGNTPSPFFFCIAAKTKVLNLQVRNSYQRFYRELFNSQNIQQAIKDLIQNDSSHDVYLADNFALHISKEQFEMMYTKEYKLKSNRELQRMLDNNIRTYWETNFNKSSKRYLKVKKQKLKEILISRAESFMMVDKFPELKDKFKMAERIEKLASKC